MIQSQAIAPTAFGLRVAPPDASGGAFFMRRLAALACIPPPPPRGRGALGPKS